MIVVVEHRVILFGQLKVGSALRVASMSIMHALDAVSLSHSSIYIYIYVHFSVSKLIFV